ncbi:hypothetical protein B0I73DRAFT_141781 [Yarrowia lipolytica]|nr:hypothetical protein B0I73DRAFT_141781 [Yarrowia lipolytica]
MYAIITGALAHAAGFVAQRNHPSGLLWLVDPVVVAIAHPVLYRNIAVWALGKMTLASYDGPGVYVHRKVSVGVDGGMTEGIRGVATGSKPAGFWAKITSSPLSLGSLERD